MMSYPPPQRGFWGPTPPKQGVCTLFSKIIFFGFSKTSKNEVFTLLRTRFLVVTQKPGFFKKVRIFHPRLFFLPFSHGGKKIKKKFLVYRPPGGEGACVFP